MKKSFILLTTLGLIMLFSGCSAATEAQATKAETAKETTAAAASEIETTAKETEASEATAATEAAEVTEAAETAAEETAEISEQVVCLPNPMVEYESLEEVNEILGGYMCKPAAMGVTDEMFWTIDAGEQGMLGQYCYELNGIGYTMRFSPNQTGDITGVYTNAGNTVYGEPNGDIIEYAHESGTLFARWFTIDGQYVFEAPSNEFTTEIFEGAAEEMYQMTLEHAVNMNGEN